MSPLSKDSTAPLRGFITDLDFAHINDLTVQQPPEPMSHTHKTFEVTVTVQRDVISSY
jgi:hypothetical protein